MFLSNFPQSYRPIKWTLLVFCAALIGLFVTSLTVFVYLTDNYRLVGEIEVPDWWNGGLEQSTDSAHPDESTPSGFAQ